MAFDRRLLEADLIRDEGLRLKPYVDTVGRLTIGVGRNLTDVGVSESEARILLGNDIDAVAAQLGRALPWWAGLSEARQRALVNMGFMGVPKLLEFRRMLAALQAGDWAEAARQALDSRWAQQVGSRAHRVAALIEEG